MSDLVLSSSSSLFESALEFVKYLVFDCTSLTVLTVTALLSTIRAQYYLYGQLCELQRKEVHDHDDVDWAGDAVIVGHYTLLLQTGPVFLLPLSLLGCLLLENYRPQWSIHIRFVERFIIVCQNWLILVYILFFAYLYRRGLSSLFVVVTGRAFFPLIVTVLSRIVLQLKMKVDVKRGEKTGWSTSSPVLANNELRVLGWPSETSDNMESLKRNWMNDVLPMATLILSILSMIYWGCTAAYDVFQNGLVAFLMHSFSLVVDILPLGLLSLHVISNVFEILPPCILDINQFKHIGTYQKIVIGGLLVLWFSSPLFSKLFRSIHKRINADKLEGEPWSYTWLEDFRSLLVRRKEWKSKELPAQGLYLIGPFCVTAILCDLALYYKSKWDIIASQVGKQGEIKEISETTTGESLTPSEASKEESKEPSQHEHTKEEISTETERVQSHTTAHSEPTTTPGATDSTEQSKEMSMSSKEQMVELKGRKVTAEVPPMDPGRATSYASDGILYATYAALLTPIYFLI